MFTKTAMKYAWSHSRLDTLETCPKRFFYNVVAGIKKDPEIGRQPKLIAGSAAHKVVELILMYGSDWDVAFKRGTKQCNEDERDEVLLSKNNIISFCKKFLSFKNNNRKIKKFLVEQSYGIDWNLKPCKFFCDEVAFRGRFDLIVISDQQLMVIDHKLSSADYKDHTVQLTGYLAILKSYFPHIKAIRAGIHYIPLGKVDWTIKQLGYGDAHEQLIERINQAGELQKTDTPKIGRHCAWCDVRFTCQRDMGTKNQHVKEESHAAADF